MCIRMAPHFSSATVRAICRSQRSPLTSLTISAPASAAPRATRDLYVSMEITASGLTVFSSVITGNTRCSSSSALTAVRGVRGPSGLCFSSFFSGSRFSAEDAAATLAPGRVDSPPTSMMSAPSSSSRSPCVTAFSGSRYKPPSEKESGVTLTMPMMSVRFPSSSVRVFKLH